MKNGIEKGRQVLSLIDEALQAAGFPALEKYTDRQAAAFANWSAMATPKIIDCGAGRGQVVGSILGSRTTRGLIFFKSTTRISGL